MKELQLTTQCYAFARVLDGKALVAVFNNGDSPAEMEFQLPVEANAATDLLADTVGAENVICLLYTSVQLPYNPSTTDWDKQCQVLKQQQMCIRDRAWSLPTLPVRMITTTITST